MSEEKFTCPKCGGKSEVFDILYMGPGCAGWLEKCLECGHEFAKDSGGDDDEDEE